MLKFASIPLFVLALVAGVPLVIAAPLPTTAIEENTVLLARFDLSRVDPTSVRATARDVLSAAAPQSAPSADLALAGLQIAHEALVNAGLQSVNVVVTARKDDQPPDYAAYLQLRPGSDETAVRKMLTEHSKPEEMPKFAHVGSYLVLYGHDQELPAAGSAARAKIFAEAMAETGSQATLAIAFVPNDQVRALANVIPTAGISPQLADVIPFVLKSRWAVIVASLGKSPGIGATIRAEDEAAAAYLTEKLKALSGDAPSSTDDEPKDPKAKPVPKHPAPGGGPGDAAEIAAGAIHPVRHGTKISFSVQGAAMKRLAAALIPSAARAGQAAAANDAADHLRALYTAFSLYVKAHNGVLPDNVQQLRPFLEKDQSLDELLKNPRTGSNPGFLYVKPAARMAAIRDPVHTPIFYESRNGARDATGAVGYAGGGVEAAPGAKPAGK